MSKLPGSLDDFLSEISASLTSSSGEAILRRINTERILKLILEEIVQQRHDLQIRILEDRRIAGQAGADILMQIDNYEIRLALLDTPTESLLLDSELLNGFRDIIEDNPSTEYIILVWTTSDLKSQKLNLQIIDYLREHLDQISDYLRKAKPLQEVIGEILSIQLKIWDSALEPSPMGASDVSDVKHLFLKHIKTTIHEERDRSYRNQERKLAALKMPHEKEVSMLSNILDDALQGMSANNLAERLTQLPKRGV